MFESAGPKATQASVPFQVSRAFVVQTETATERGHHAHKSCRQFAVALRGSCRMRCYDGTEWREFSLRDPATGLLIPAGIWTEQHYGDNSTLLVLCDLPYAEADYIRDYAEFVRYRQGSTVSK
ncbi:MAG: FdtA/QdtA family cupin domain-containing protein [Rhodobacteraceae bacterium]|nr:FdtA/QdtA family cupin domain-containing protein [Paracoccaceae bacterium]